MSMENAPVVSIAGTNISPISQTAADEIRFRFNPSQQDTVARIKTLTGSLITMMEELGVDPAKARLSKLAISHITTASMWSVLTATQGLTQAYQPKPEGQPAEDPKPMTGVSG